MHTMTSRQGKSGTIDIKALLAEDEEFLRALVRTALQEVLEAEMTDEEAEKLWPHSSSVIAFTFRVETPCTYISASAATSARSSADTDRTGSVENRPVRSCGTRNSSLPTRVINVRP